MSTQIRMDPARHGPLYPHMRNPAAGQIFYVHRASEGADDANDGRTPQTAFLTMEHALSRCTTGANDYIYVLRHDAATETWPITVSIAYVHIIGTPYQATPTPAFRPNTDNHGINITGGGGVEIAGFIFSMDHTYGDACIRVGDNSWMNHIHHNWFAWDSEAYDCIVDYGEQTRIHDNLMGAHGFTHYGIWLDPSGGRRHIHDNVIIQNGIEEQGTRCVHAQGHANVIVNNVFQCAAGANGEAIQAAGGTANSLIDGNHAAGPAAGMGAFNPYREVLGAAASYWGINYAANAPVLPVVI